MKNLLLAALALVVLAGCTPAEDANKPSPAEGAATGAAAPAPDPAKAGAGAQAVQAGEALAPPGGGKDSVPGQKAGN